MPPFKRPLAAAGTAVLLSLSVAACGESAPTDASEDEFCETYLDTSWQEGVGEEDFDAQEEALQERADELEEVGTPEDIPDDAREGFEVQLEVLRDISAEDLEDSQQEDSTIEEEFEEEYADSKDEVDAFEEYVGDTCNADTPGEGTGGSDDMSSETPAETPSETAPTEEGDTETDMGTDTQTDMGTDTETELSESPSEVE
ncbi:hypothetical protein [Nocardioides sp. SYSU DS0651]|uniref:hypothetical protein n=1 Tax=Nocardioides sp. SYSU DS0651 TaxID=3415955 RepID=UPI003F4C27AD